MGTIILVVAAILEAALTGYCIITKSRQIKIKSWVRIGSFGLFVLFTACSVIVWSFRWTMLAAILLIMAIAGVLALVRKKEDAKKFRTVPAVFKAVVVWLLILVSITPALIFPQHRSPAVTGNLKVETALFTFTDDSRKDPFENTGSSRKVTVEFWYPAGAGTGYPLVVFSHGAFGIMASNTSTYTDLASNGYVVCSISHPYHSLYCKDTDGKWTLVDRSFMREVIDVNNGVYSEKEIYELERKWMKVRTGDMNFVVDTILDKAADTDSPEVFRKIDAGKIGLMGHSLGGAASAQLGRERRDIGAVIDIDGGLLGEYIDFKDGLPVANPEAYPVPILGIFTDAMKQALASVEDTKAVIAEKQVFATAPEAFQVYFKGTNHMSVTDLPLVSPFLVDVINGTVQKNGGRQAADRYEVIETMNRIILEFFDCYLKGKGSFQSAGAEHEKPRRPIAQRGFEPENSGCRY
jgi:dienelactone hydrolase